MPLVMPRLPLVGVVRGGSRGGLGAMRRGPITLAVLALLGGMLLGSLDVRAQQPVAPPPVATSLVFDGVTVIDVEQGKHLPSQRVVMVGNRITAMGKTGTIRIPEGAQVIDATGKYLIPGLWDLHVHPRRSTKLFYPLLLANGVTGIRDAGSEVPIDTLQLWRREILAGTRVGPPRQLLAGQSIAGPRLGCERSRMNAVPQTCVADSADAVHYVDSLVAAGADMIKPRDVSKDLYFIIAAASRRRGIPFGGHAEGVADVSGRVITALQASDSGAGIIDHVLGEYECWREFGNWDSTAFQNNLARCQEHATHFRRNGTWLSATLIRTPILRGRAANAVFARFRTQADAFWKGTLPQGNWLRDSVSTEAPPEVATRTPTARVGAMTMTQQANLPLLAATDAGAPVLRELPPGFALHAELAMMVAEGITPLNALQSATLNPARFLRATDSLGTVAVGKLADLVLLDADPLADITNTTMIRAVVANGWYYDRAALDRLLIEVQPKR